MTAIVADDDVAFRLLGRMDGDPDVPEPAERAGQSGTQKGSDVDALEHWGGIGHLCGLDCLG